MMDASYPAYSKIFGQYTLLSERQHGYGHVNAWLLETVIATSLLPFDILEPLVQKQRNTTHA